MKDQETFSSLRPAAALSPELEERLPRWEKRYGYVLAALFGLVLVFLKSIGD